MAERVRSHLSVVRRFPLKTIKSSAHASLKTTYCIGTPPFCIIAATNHITLQWDDLRDCRQQSSGDRHLNNRSLRQHGALGATTTTVMQAYCTSGCDMTTSKGICVASVIAPFACWGGAPFSPLLVVHLTTRFGFDQTLYTGHIARSERRCADK